MRASLPPWKGSLPLGLLSGFSCKVHSQGLYRQPQSAQAASQLRLSDFPCHRHSLKAYVDGRDLGPCPPRSQSQSLLPHLCAISLSNYVRKAIRPVFPSLAGGWNSTVGKGDRSRLSRPDISFCPAGAETRVQGKPAAGGVNYAKKQTPPLPLWISGRTEKSGAAEARRSRKGTARLGRPPRRT